jgi:hypothetical protein
VPEAKISFCNLVGFNPEYRLIPIEKNTADLMSARIPQPSIKYVTAYRPKYTQYCFLINFERKESCKNRIDKIISTERLQSGGLGPE